MKKYFADTNIIVDLLADRKPFSKFAIDIFFRAETGEIKLYTSSYSIATIYYLLRKYSEDKELRKSIYNLFEYMTIIQVNADILKKGLLSKHKDFENAIQIYCASTIKSLDGIITRNIKDFVLSEIKVYAPEEV